MVVGQFHRRRSERQVVTSQLTEELRLRQLLRKMIKVETEAEASNEKERLKEQVSSNAKLEQYQHALNLIEENSSINRFIKVVEQNKRHGADGKVPFGSFAVVFLLAWIGAFVSMILPLCISEHREHLRQHLAQLFVWPLLAALLTLILFANRFITMRWLLQGGLKRVWIFVVVGWIVMYGVLFVLVGMFPTSHIEHGDLFGHTEGGGIHSHDEL